MKKQLIIFSIVVLLTIVVLCGCTENSNKFIKIIDYEISEPQDLLIGGIGDYRILISGTAENTGDSMLWVTIRAKFYDKDNIFLGWNNVLSESKNHHNYKVPPRYDWEFTLEFVDDYADKVDHLEFVILANK